MKKHLLALLSVGSLVTLLPGCGSCCEMSKKEMAVEEAANTEVAAVESEVVTEAAPVQDVANPETAPVVEDKH
jgi:hypothetical protein